VQVANDNARKLDGPASVSRYSIPVFEKDLG
jgi:hypothetical protein